MSSDATDASDDGIADDRLGPTLGVADLDHETRRLEAGAGLTCLSGDPAPVEDGGDPRAGAVVVGDDSPSPGAAPATADGARPRKMSRIGCACSNVEAEHGGTIRVRKSNTGSECPAMRSLPASAKVWARPSRSPGSTPSSITRFAPPTLISELILPSEVRSI